eukprot:7407391-Ditylum_brightwellii.AAC.1
MEIFCCFKNITMGSNIPPLQAIGTKGGAPAILPMRVFGAGMLGTGGVAAPMVAPNPEDFPRWMQHA